MDNDNTRYVMIKTAPSPSSEEVEADKIETELSILWGESVLFSSTINKTFTIGEEGDFILPMEKHTLIKDGIMFAPHPIQLTKEFSQASFGDFKVRARLVQAGKAHPISLFENFSHSIYVVLSGVVHFALLCALAFFMPPMGIADAEEANKDNMYLMQQYLQASAERELESKPAESVVDDKNSDNKEGGTGQRAVGEEGSMGNPNARANNSRFGIAGPKDNKDIHIAREAALREASTYGMIGLLNMGAGGDPNAPTAPWGRDDSLGADPISARGNMWGADIGDSFGSNGLGLSGIGDGGGGKGEGIGLGSVGTIGHGAGLGPGQGFGNGHGYLNGGHKMKVPTVRYGSTTVTGSLPAEVIQRIVRQNYGRFRVCYENGLRANPNLQGRVAVRFVIGRDGGVSNVGNSGSDLPDQNVTQCVIRAFYGLSFPEPEGVIVTVVYPIMFSAQ